MLRGRAGAGQRRGLAQAPPHLTPQGIQRGMAPQGCPTKEGASGRASDAGRGVSGRHWTFRARWPQLPRALTPPLLTGLNAPAAPTRIRGGLLGRGPHKA